MICIHTIGDKRYLTKDLTLDEAHTVLADGNAAFDVVTESNLSKPRVSRMVIPVRSVVAVEEVGSR